MSIPQRRGRDGALGRSGRAQPCEWRMVESVGIDECTEVPSGREKKAHQIAAIFPVEQKIKVISCK